MGNLSEPASGLSNDAVDPFASLSVGEVLGASSELFVLLDGDFRIRFLNAAAERQLGITLAEVAGRSHWEQFPASVGTEVEREYRRAMRDQVHVHLTHRYVDDRYDAYLDIDAYPVRGGLAIFYRDVSDQARRLREAQETAEQLETQAAELEEATADAIDARHRITTILDGIGDMVVTFDADWRWTYLNPPARELLDRIGGGGSYEGRVVWEEMPQLLGTRFETETKRARDERRIVTYEEHLPAAGLWLNARIVPDPHGGGVTCFLRDVTETVRLFSAEREARAAAERSAELTRRLQEVTASFARTLSLDEVATTTLSHGLEALDAASGVVYVADEQEPALDLVAHHGIGDDVVRPYLHLEFDASHPVTDAIRARETLFLADPAERRERYPQARTTGPQAADAWIAVPLLHGERVLGAIALGFNGPRTFTAEERALADALGRHCSQAMERARLLDAERDSRDDAERANQAKSELLAKVSHETRQPVHATIGWIDTLDMELQGPVTDAMHEALRRMKQNQLRLLSVLNDLLDISRIEAGKLELRIDEVVVADVVDAVEAAVKPQMTGKQLDFQFCRPDPSVKVRADADQVIGILTNLLSNAGKFTAPGGAVSVTCDVRDDVVNIVVRDTGIGIPAAVRDRVFEPFFQVESGFTRTTVGTGLGLAISREAARAMGGEIHVTSEVGVGSVFTLELPRAP